MMTEKDIQAAVDELIDHLRTVRSLFNFAVEMGDWDSVEIAFNAAMQTAHGALSVVDPALPLADPTRAARDYVGVYDV